jgi:hypothetical protein
MRAKQELALLQERAVMLRREGKSLRQVKQILGPMSNVTLHDALRGVPPPDWTRRPNAKDELREKARVLARGHRRSAGTVPQPRAEAHNPKAVRKNVGEDYHGCLRVEVRGGSGLYRKIEGWAEAIMSAPLTRNG